MKINNNFNQKQERVEVMALFGYAMTPCQPLTFKSRGEQEIEVTELIRSQVKFAGKTTKHIFDVLAGKQEYRLTFDSVDLTWVAELI